MASLLRLSLFRTAGARCLLLSPNADRLENDLEIEQDPGSARRHMTRPADGGATAGHLPAAGTGYGDPSRNSDRCGNLRHPLSKRFLSILPETFTKRVSMFFF